ncbi:uncharacterized protein LOC100180048 [Ciona intestinalis]
MLPHIKIAIIGASGSGKTSFIRKFKTNQFIQEDAHKDYCEMMSPDLKRRNRNSKAKEAIQASLDVPAHMERCQATTCTVLFKPKLVGKHNGVEDLLDITLMDFREFEKFPLDSLEEWETRGAIGVRSADAYILFYDVTNFSSLEHVINMREGIVESCALSMEGQANGPSNSRTKYKVSPIFETSAQMNCFSDQKIRRNSDRPKKTKKSFLSRRSNSQTSSSESIKVRNIIASSFLSPLAPVAAPRTNDTGVFKSSPRQYPPVFMVVGNKRDLCTPGLSPIYNYGPAASSRDGIVLRNREVNERKVSQLAKKSWRSQHFESSVKFGWNVNSVIHETIKMVMTTKYPKRYKP